MKIPFLIFLVSGLAALQLEPLETRGAKILRAYALRHMQTYAAGRVPPASAGQIGCLQEQLADVQLDLMKVLETDHTITGRLEAREADLKYALRAEQVRRDEMAQCLKNGRAEKSPASNLAGMAERCVSGSEKPRS